MCPLGLSRGAPLLRVPWDPGGWSLHGNTDSTISTEWWGPWRSNTRHICSHIIGQGKWTAVPTREQRGAIVPLVQKAESWKYLVNSPRDSRILGKLAVTHRCWSCSVTWAGCWLHGCVSFEKICWSEHLGFAHFSLHAWHFNKKFKNCPPVLAMPFLLFSGALIPIEPTISYATWFYLPLLLELG